MTFLNLLYYFCTEAKTILTETSACDIKKVLFNKKPALLRKKMKTILEYSVKNEKSKTCISTKIGYHC